MDNNIEASDLVKTSRDKGLDYQGYEKAYEDYLRDNELKGVDLRKASEDYYNDNQQKTGSDTIIDGYLSGEVGEAKSPNTPPTKSVRGTRRTPTVEQFKAFVSSKLKTKGGKAMKDINNQDGIRKHIRPIFQEFFKSENVLSSLQNEEYRDLLALVSAFRERFNIDETAPDALKQNLTNFLFYGKSGTGKKLGDTTRFFDALYNAPPNDREALKDIIDTYITNIKADRSISDKFNEEREIELFSDAVRDFGILETREELPDTGEEEQDTEPKLKGVVERVMEEQRKRKEKEEEEEEEEQEQEQEQEQEPETLEETLETAQETEPEEPTPPPPVDMTVSKPRKETKTETISNPVGQNLIDQIPAEMISTQFKNIEELKQEIEFLLDKFPELLIRESEIYTRVDLDDIDQLRRLHKTIIGKLGADRQTQKIAVVIPAEDYIKAEVNKILLNTALKNMRAEDIIQTINMPNRQGEQDGLTVGDFVVREGNTSGLQNQGQPIYRYIPTTNPEVSEQQTRTGKIRLNTTKRTRLNVAKREFRNDPFIFRRPQPIRLKYIG